MTWLALLLAPFLAHADTVADLACDRESVAQRDSFSDQLDRILAGYVAEDPALFCASAIRVRLAQERGLFQDEKRAPGAADMDEALRDRLKSASPWLLTLVPSEASKQDGMNRALKMIPIPKDARNHRQKPVAEWLAHASAADAQALAAAWPGQLTFGAVKAQGREAMSQGTNFATRAGACEIYGSRHPLDCQKALTGVVAHAAVTHQAGISFSFTGEIESLLRSGKAREGLRIAALKLLDRTRNPPAEGADLFGDLKASFVEGGLSEGDAEEASWSTLGVISTSGADLVMRMVKLKLSSDQMVPAVSLSAIAAAVPLLDAQYKGSGHLYSYPPSVHTTCDTGKSYHFWMAAYLARQAAREGAKPGTAAEAAYVANVGYHLKDDDVLKLLPGSRSFSPAFNILRADFAYAAAGARFGAGAGTAYDIDKGIRGAVARSKNVGPENSLERAFYERVPAAQFRRFDALVDPKGIFNSYR